MTRLRPILILLTLAGLCLVGAVGAGFAAGVPRNVEGTFGPPAPTLSASQRFQLALTLFLRRETLLKPANPPGAPQPFSISFGESTPGVIQRLEQAGLITDPVAFRSYLVYRGLDTHLQAGDYTLSPAMTPVEIAAALQDATPAEVVFAILPGWRLEEIAASLPTSGLNINLEQFLAAARNHPSSYLFSLELPQRATSEGFLLPGTYTYPRDIPTPQFLASLFDNFENQLAPEILRGLENQGLSLYEGVTLASIVQREAVVAEEQPLIASVFLNRLAQGMKLDADPTVQYALGPDPQTGNWWKSPLALADLQVDSYYNTYLYPGLPPGPIANPGLSALRAVAFPAQTPYYFFRARCDGSGRHFVAETFAGHQSNACP